MNTQSLPSTFIRLPSVMARTSISRSSIYKQMEEGTFPKQVNTSAKSVAWVSHEIDEWIVSKINSRDTIH